MIDHAMIDRHFAVELFTECHMMDIRKMCKAIIETSNRSWGQKIRYTREQFDLAKMETENLGDDAGMMCSGIQWGDA
jgi:hypothetical protein